MARFQAPRWTLRASLVLVALVALIFAYFRPRTTRVYDVQVGSGRTVQKGDRVEVHYVGTLADGTVFDSSKVRDQPIEFILGQGNVIRGWDLGVEGMRVGGKRRLVIPPNEGYGDKGVPSLIPPKSTLSFEVELLGPP